MRYIARDKDGKITGTFAREQYEGQEKLSVGDSEVQTFINRPMVDPDEAKIQAEITELNRAAAIQSLKDKGELQINFKG